MRAIFILVIVFIVRSVIPEDRLVFIKIDALLISLEIVPKMFACLVDLVTSREVAESAEILGIGIIKFLRVLCVKNVTGMCMLNMIFASLSQRSTFVCCGLVAIFLCAVTIL